MVYQYNKYVKRNITFYYDENQQAHIPVDTFGVGDEHGNGIGRIYKDIHGIVLEYVRWDGTTSGISIGDYVDANYRRLSSCTIRNGTVTYQMEGDAAQYTLQYTVSGNTVRYTWPDGHTSEVTIG